MPGGRDQLGPLERLTRLLLVLEAAEPAGLPASRLVSVGQYGADLRVRRAAAARA